MLWMSSTSWSFFLLPAPPWRFVGEPSPPPLPAPLAAAASLPPENLSLRWPRKMRSSMVLRTMYL